MLLAYCLNVWWRLKQPYVLVPWALWQGPVFETRWLAKVGTYFSCPSGCRGPTLAPTKLVYVCTLQVLFPSKREGIAHPLYLPEARGYSTPPPLICLGGPTWEWDCVLSMHAAGHPEESTALLRLMVVASSQLLLVLEGVGLMPVLSRLDPFPQNDCD